MATAASSPCSYSLVKPSTLFSSSSSIVPTQTLVFRKDFTQRCKLSIKQNSNVVNYNYNKKQQSRSRSSAVVVLGDKDISQGGVLVEVVLKALKKASLPCAAVVVSLFHPHSSALAAPAIGFGGSPRVYLSLFKFAAYVSVLRLLWYSWDARTLKADLKRVAHVMSLELKMIIYFVNGVKTQAWRFVYSGITRMMMEECDWISFKLMLINLDYTINTQGWIYYLTDIIERTNQDLGWLVDFANAVWHFALTDLFVKLWIDKVATISTGGSRIFLSVAGFVLAMLQLLDCFLLPYLSEKDKDVDERNARLFKWNIERDNYFLKWLVEEVKKGKKIYGTSNKTLHLQAALVISEQFGTICSTKNVIERLEDYKNSYALLKKLKDESGLSLVTIREEVWKKKHSVYFPEVRRWLKRIVDIYDQLAIICSEDQDIDLEAEPRDDRSNESEILDKVTGLKE